MLRRRRSRSRRCTSRFTPESGFGVQLLYDDVGERAQVARHGDVIVIRSGYDPVVAASGHGLYHLWVMAGQGRALRRSSIPGTLGYPTAAQ
jgi:5-deoxy-D-glucuronate isomerase